MKGAELALMDEVDYLSYLDSDLQFVKERSLWGALFEEYLRQSAVRCKFSRDAVSSTLVCNCPLKSTHKSQ